MVDRLDMAAARAIQYARTLYPDDLRAVHVDVDNKYAKALEEEWGRVGLARLPLDIVECPDRRLLRATVEIVADAVMDGETECTVLLPRRGFASGWQRFLHDRTADKIAAVISQIPHASATIVPYNLRGSVAERGRRYQKVVAEALAEGGLAPRGPGSEDVEGPSAVAAVPVDATRAGRRDRARERAREREREGQVSAADRALAQRSAGTAPIGSATFRQRTRVAGRVRSVRVQPRAGTQNLECVLSDGTGGILLVFQGRPKIPGIEPGARLVAEGMVGAWGRRLAILNPDYELVAGADADGPEGGG